MFNSLDSCEKPAAHKRVNFLRQNTTQMKQIFLDTPQFPQKWRTKEPKKKLNI